MKDCWYYEAGKSKEQMRELAAIKIAERSKKKAEKKKLKTEKVGKCAEAICDCKSIKNWEITDREIVGKTAALRIEQCLVIGVKPNEVDFVYDSGTHHGVVSERDKDILHEVVEDPVLLEGVGGHTSLSKEIGDSIFGKTRVLKNRVGSILVSNYSTRNLFQVINPNPDCFILRGWDTNPKTRGMKYIFERDIERYGDPLLHCTMPIKIAKSMVNVEKFYDPPRVPDVLDKSEIDIIAKVEVIHRKWNHASAQELIRLNKVANGVIQISNKEIEMWKKLHGDFCSGCIEGSIKEQNRVKSTKPLVAREPGDIGVADLMFVEGRAEIKTPLYVHADVKSKLIIGVPMKDKTREACLDAFKTIKSAHQVANRRLKSVVFDRESAIVALETEIIELGIELILKAAGQKVGLAEVDIRIIRIKSRSSKAGVRERYGYLPANQFNMDLCMDSIGVVNRIPKEGESKTPFELFTGKEPDWIRDFRADWGEPIIVKKPKGIAADLKVVGEWAIIVRRIMNGTGVLKVYLIQSKKYAYRLKFKRAKAPEWVINALNSISRDQKIGFEEPDDNPESISAEESMKLMIHEPYELLENQVEPEEVLPEPRIGEMTDVEVQEALDAIDAIEADNVSDAIDESNILEKVETTMTNIPADNIVTRSRVTNRNQLELERDAELYAERVAQGIINPEDVDKGRVVFDRRHRRTEANVIRAQEVLRKAYLERYGGSIKSEDEYSDVNLDVEFSGIVFQQAMKSRPEAAEEALVKEVRKTIEKKIWHPIHEEDMTLEQKMLILPIMKNYVEKFTPDNVFEKSKVRVLIRGDLQTKIGENEGPVCRFESILIVLSIAGYLELEVFKVDISSAYMNTPIPEDVKHRWVRLDRDVVRVLMKLMPGYWDNYVQNNGSVVVEMDKLMYGYKEAAKYWNVTLIDVFLKMGYTQCRKDKCVMIKRQNNKLAICAITVDDCLFVTTKDEQFIQEQIKMLTDAFEEITVERGNDLGIVGIQVKIDRESHKIILSQRKFAAKVVEVFGVTKGAPNPALTDVMGDDDESPLLKDQKEFMSKNSLLMFGATRTYPEIRPFVGRLATKYNKATELDMKKAYRIAEYIYGCMEEHVMVLEPKSLQIVAVSDASYAENPDGTSNDGGCVGFESDVACWFAVVTGKQSWTVLSACEAELVASCRVGTFVEWAKQFMEELGFEQGTIIMYHDSTCAMAMLAQGTGSFKRAKHIKVRYFWVRDLVDQGVVELKYRQSKELVADMLTKPVVGAHFWYLLKKLIGWSRVQPDKSKTEEVC
jgi:hypothetical protein